jgi:hypothetical protein
MRRMDAKRALVFLLRGALAQKAGLRAARILGLLWLVGTAAGMALLAYRFGSDGSAVSLAARAAAAITFVCGWLAALSIAQPRKNRSTEDGVVALARSRGFGGGEIQRAELAAGMVLACEVVFVPIAILCLLAGAAFTGWGTPAAWAVLAGTMSFGLFASVVIGAVASLCRRLGGDRGRRWLVSVVIIPWLVAGALIDGREAAYLSIPGLLGRAWEGLTQVGS